MPSFAQVTVSVEVPQASSVPTEVPRTGFEAGPWLALALMLFCVGVLLTRIAHLRKERDA